MKEELIDGILDGIIKFHRAGFLKLLMTENLSTSEMILLYAMYSLKEEQDKLMLSTVRDVLQLAPSTITAVITTLEEKELIERIIDKNDRRNICINITKKGEQYVKKVEKNNKEIISQYIDYMGEKDAVKFLELMSKTTKFINENKFLGEE